MSVHISTIHSPAGNPMGSYGVALIRSVSAILVAAVISLSVENALSEIAFKPYYHSIPVTFGDYMIRVAACVVSVSAARFFWNRERYLLPITMAVFYGSIAAVKIFAFVPIDWWPFFPHLSLPSAKVAWTFVFLTATVFGSISGQWAGKRLNQQIIKHQS